MESQNYLAKRRVLLERCLGVAPNKSVLTGPQILDDWFLESKHALNSVEGKTMALWPDEIGMRILGMFQILPKHLRKNLEVDSFSRLTSQFGDIDFLRRYLPFVGSSYRRYEQARKAFFNLFEKTGAAVNFTNPPRGLLDKLIPFRNRDHGKYLSVDADVFYLIDFNLFGGNTTAVSLGIKFVGEEARKIIETLEYVKKHPLAEDLCVQISEHTWFRIDCGRKNQSGIMDGALENSAQATSTIQRLSLSTPDGLMAKAFKQAEERGVKTETLTGTDKFQVRLPPTIPQLVWASNKLAGLKHFILNFKSPVLTHLSRFVHSKALIFDGGKTDGKTTAGKAIFGSHNFDDKGPGLGTVEYAILTTDPKIVSALRTKIGDVKADCNPQLAFYFN